MANIAIVDDHPFVRLGVRAALSADPSLKVVFEADDGLDAWLRIQQEAPDVVVLDLELPRLDGYELIKRIRRAESPTKVLVLSVHGGALAVQRAMRAGADGFIDKRNKPEQVRQGCHAVLSGYTFFPGAASRHVGARECGLAVLTDREMAVARHLVAGVCQKEVARLLYISHKTVSAHKRNVFRKLGVQNLIQLADYLRDTDSFGRAARAEAVLGEQTA